MTTTTDCSQITDALKLVREGTSQDQRLSRALDPVHAPVNERTPAHGMVFAQSYSALLRYFGDHNLDAGDWTPFFTKDVAARLALVSIEDIESYKSGLKSWFDYLNNLENHIPVAGLKDNFGFLYNSLATLAWQLDEFKEGLPREVPLKGTLQNLIKSQLAPAFRRLIAYYRAGVTRTLINATLPSPNILILRCPVVSFESVLVNGLSGDWSDGQEWASYASLIGEDASVYGEAAGSFVQINHCSTHNLFKSVFDEFLKAFARVVDEAGKALNDTLAKWDKHEPHYALFLAFLRLFEYARAQANTLTERHLDFYYREILRLKERAAEPGHAHLLVELAKQVASREFKAGELFRAGKDDSGHDVFFANENDFVANQAKVTALKTVYRHGDEKVGTVDPTDVHKGRIFASPVANSDDGLGAKLVSTDMSWHPFYNKVYTDGVLSEIRMPQAEIGFAVASHYLLMEEGRRWVIVLINTESFDDKDAQDLRSGISCSFTSVKGWLEIEPSLFIPYGDNELLLLLEVSGTEAPIRPYSAKTHGGSFQTDLPMLMVKLKHDENRAYAYSAFQDVVITGISLYVYAEELKSLAVSNDFGPVDASKPFQPFGSSPESGSSMVIGSKEVFQKTLSSAWVNVNWVSAPYAYATPTTSGTLPTVKIDYLSKGHWNESSVKATAVSSVQYSFNDKLNEAVLDEEDFSANELYDTHSRQGFMRLRLTGNFGQNTHQSDLLKYIRKDNGALDPGKPPVGPTASSLSMCYVACSELSLEPSAKDYFEKRNGQFFHLSPFGQAEQHPFLNTNETVYLFPQFSFGRDKLESESEFFIGITGLQPPQSLSLLFQVADGTANPLAYKPSSHISWSYLKNNEWTGFAANEVLDGTGGLLNSGIVTLAVPSGATSDNTVLPAGQVWIRAAVHEASDAVCRLQRVAAQALRAGFVDRGNSRNFPATPLAAETISKLDVPDSAVKSVIQPFTSFGGRGVEQPAAFRTRISERLRHKDRAIALWDYERIVLEAFPQIYKVKCLNHTYYEPTKAIPYRELAPGHVTIIAIPNLQFQKLRDPLKPFTSVGLLLEIEAFLKKRTSCFTTLHVKNPRFEEVRVSFGLRLFDGFDETYYTNLLQQAITRFLSPWAFVVGGTPSFGGKICKSVLINFIEDQPYVDYVTDFFFPDMDGLPPRHDLDELEGSTAVSILVSAPAGKHDIHVIKSTLEDIPSEKCPCAT